MPRAAVESDRRVVALPRRPVALAVAALLLASVPVVLSGSGVGLRGAPGIGAGSAPAGVLVTGRQRPPDFRVASFNLLGHDHTIRSQRWANGRKRMTMAVDLIKRLKIGIVGFQEFQEEQRARFMKLTGDNWAHYPGDKLNFTEMHNSIAWRRARWKPVEKHTKPIPYFHGKLQRMPYLLLKHRETGRLVWFANFHNPANARGNAEKWRDEATDRQIRLANRLADTGYPVVFTGDMNEREEYFCRFTRWAPMKAAQGGSARPGRRCRPPTWPTQRPGIDWIFGSRKVLFDDYKRREGPTVTKISDHPLIHVEVRFRRRR